MKITHRVPPRDIASDPISESYQAEVDRSTAKLERLYAAAQRRLEAATRRAEKVEQRRAKPRDISVAWALVEIRRQELADVERLMHAVGAGVTHRGRKSYRPVPVTHGVRL